MQRWQWNVQQDQVQARYRSGGAPAPFAPLGIENLLQNFFQSQASVSVVVDVKVEFQDGSSAETTTSSFTVRPSFSSEIVTGMVMKADGQQLSHLYGRAGTLPNLEWTVTTSTALPNQVQVGIFKQSGSQIACQTLENATSQFSQITPSNGPNGKIYTLTAESASGLFSLLSTQGAGRYEIRFSGAACSGGDWSSAQVSLITLNSNLAFRLRFHYRDHLGSSTVSRAYTPEYQAGIAGAATFSLKMSALGNQFVTLYAQPEKATNFTPFGKPMGDVNEEPNPRYTDHEFDAESGLNYMKGRYQLANFAKFNRPDPMRDWDWENPSSINLYQYVRNNPIDSWDPDGFTITEDILKSAERDINKGGFWNKVKGVSKFVAAVAREGLGAAATNELAEKAVNGEKIGAMDVLAAAGDLPGLKQAKAAGKTLEAGGSLVKAVWKHGDEGLDAAQELKKVEKGVTKELDASKIRFSQDSIKGTFTDGRSVDDLVKGLKDGSIKPSDVPAIRTVERNGQLISIDNRRLAAFKEAGIPIRTRPATAAEIAQAQKQGKFSAGASGSDTIRIRGDK